MFSKLYSLYKKWLGKPKANSLDCCKLNLSIPHGDGRVDAFAKAAPSCICESQKVSDYSPGPICREEVLSRFVKRSFVKSNGSLAPSFTAHVDSKGCSIQRESIASTDELVNIISELSKPENPWVGMVFAKCAAVRDIKMLDGQYPSVCVYDTANKDNPAHAEIFKAAPTMPNADRLELRNQVLKLFSSEAITGPESYRGGEVLKRLLRKQHG